MLVLKSVFCFKLLMLLIINEFGVFMSFFNLSSKNISLKVIDGDISFSNPNECFVEVIVKRAFLREFLASLLLPQDKYQCSDISLTKREKQVLKFLSSGKNNAQIAESMHVSVHTTKVHIHNIFSKLSVQDRTEAVVKAIKYKLIDI